MLPIDFQEDMCMDCLIGCGWPSHTVNGLNYIMSDDRATQGALPIMNWATMWNHTMSDDCATQGAPPHHALGYHVEPHHECDRAFGMGN